jgi:hypothetical protein
MNTPSTPLGQRHQLAHGLPPTRSRKPTACTYAPSFLCHTRRQARPLASTRLTHDCIVFVSQTGEYLFDTCGSEFDTYLLIFEKTGSNPGINVGEQIASCDGCGNCGSQAQLAVLLTPGAYWVVLEGSANQSGVYNLTADCSTPDPTLAGTLPCGVNSTGNTTGAINAVGSTSPENWWAFTAVDGGSYIFDSCGSDFDT